MLGMDPSLEHRRSQVHVGPRSMDRSEEAPHQGGGAGIRAQAWFLKKSWHHNCQRQNALTSKEVVLLGLLCWGDCSLMRNASKRKGSGVLQRQMVEEGSWG